MARILVTEEIADGGLDRLRAAGHQVDVQLDLSKLHQVLPGAQALIVRSATQVDTAALDAGADLLVIGRAGIGPAGIGPNATPTAASCFPSAATVAGTPLDTLGMPASRRATIHELARAVTEGRLDLGPTSEPDRLRRQLLALPGIGPWTAGYIAMRIRPGGDGDGWPRGDLVLRQSFGTTGPELERRAERWRPWRAYAALLLWRTAPPPAPRTPRAAR
jgi:hypothetical protein